MSEAQVRLAAIEDLPTLNQISVASKKHWGYPDDWIQNWLDDLRIDKDHLQTNDVYVLELDEGLAGFCSISELVDRYEVEHLWLSPEYIGKGLGKLLLNESLTNSVKDIKRVVVEADPNAEPFYQSQGFITIDKIESYPKGRFLPIMEKRS